MKNLLLLLLFLGVAIACFAQISNSVIPGELQPIFVSSLSATHPQWQITPWGNPGIIEFINGGSFSQTPSLASGTITYYGAGFDAGKVFRVPIVMRTGKVFIPGYNTSHSLIFDPANNTLATGPATFGLATGLMLSSGKLWLINYSAGTTRLYDPVTTAVTAGPTITGINFGVTNMPNGMTLIAKQLVAGNLQIYNPVANSITDGRLASPSYGCILAPDGKVVLAPYGTATRVDRYNPTTNLLELDPTHGEGINAFSGGCILKDGKIFLAPSSSQYVGIYDPVANTYTRKVAKPAASDFDGATLRPDGKVQLGNRVFAGCYVYDPVANVFEYHASMKTGSNFTLMPDGRFIAGPYGQTTTQVVVLNAGFNAVGLETATLPWWNKR